MTHTYPFIDRLQGYHIEPPSRRLYGHARLCRLQSPCWCASTISIHRPGGNASHAVSTDFLCHLRVSIAGIVQVVENLGTVITRIPFFGVDPSLVTKIFLVGHGLGGALATIAGLALKNVSNQSVRWCLRRPVSL